MALPSCRCVGAYPNWKILGPIVAAARTWAGESPDLHCFDNRPIIDQLRGLYCATLTVSGGGGGGGGATLLASFYIPEIVDSFERDIAAGFTGIGDPDPYQREAEPDILRDEHYQDGIDGQLVILEDDPTLTDLIPPEIGTPVVSVNEVTIPFTPGYGDVGSTEYSWDLTDTWLSAGTSPLVVTGTAGSHVIYFRDVSPSGVPGQEAPSDSFDLEAVSGDPSSRVDLVFRYIGDSAPGIEGAEILTWTDDSGNGNTATSSTGIAPIKNLALANGHDVAQFGFGPGPAYQLLFLPDCISSLTEGTVYYVIKGRVSPVVDASLGGLGNLGAQDFDEFLEYVDENSYLGFGTSARKTVGDLGINISSEFFVLTIVSQAGEFTVYVNGVQQFNTAINTVSFPVAPRIGASFGPGIYFNGWMADCFVASNADDSSTVAATAGWCLDQYVP